MGEVRGTFDLNDRPATAALRRLRREGELTDATFESLGRTVDGVFTDRNIAEVDAYERKLKSVSREAATSLGLVRREWSATEREVIKSVGAQEAAIDRLDERTERLSRKRITPQIDVDGVTEALAQLALLEQRADALSRQTIRPTVSLPGITGASTIASSGPRSSSFGGSLNVPFAGSVPLGLAGGALAAAPPLLGAAVATASSLGGAALGAGSIGVAGAGVGAAAIGQIAPVAISAVAGIKEAATALEDYQQEVIQSGRNSEAARQKFRAFNLELRSAPAGTRRFLRAKSQLGDEFDAATRPAQRDFTAIGTRGLNLGRQLTPLYARQANRFFGEARGQADEFGDFLASDRAKQFYGAMGSEATASLGPAEDIAENVTSTLMSLSRAARPFFREGLHFLDEWTGGWRKSSRDVRGVREDMRGWVGDLKAWGKLTGATFRLLGDVGGASRESGTGLVGDLTAQMNEWDRWIDRNPRQVRQFFDDAVDGTEKIAGATGKIANLLWRIGQQLTPLLEQGADLVSLLGSAGLLTPGGLPLLLGARAGFNNARTGFSNRVTGAGAGSGMGEAPLILGGGSRSPAPVTGTGRYGAPLARGEISTAYQLERDAGLSRLAAAGTVATETSAASRFAAFGRGFVGHAGPLLALSVGLGALSTQPVSGGLTGAGERLEGGLSQASFGIIPPPPTADERFAEGFAGAQHRFANPTTQRGTAQGINQLTGEHFFDRSELADMHGRPGRPILRARHGLRHARGEDSPDAAGEVAFFKQQLALIRGTLSRRAEGKVSDIREALGINLRHDVKGARRQAVESIDTRLSGTRNAEAAQRLGQQGLGLAKELALENPKLKGIVGNLSETIEQRLEKLGRRVRVINGNIVDTSAKSWGRVAEIADRESQQAYASASKNLTALEKRAVSILRHMGFSPGTARTIAQQATMGGEAGSLARQAAGADVASADAGGHLDPHYLPGRRREGATGMRATGRLAYPANGSDRDEVPLGGNQFGAGGELVVPSHVERRVNRMLGVANTGTTLGRETAMNNRATWQMPGGDYGLGGRMQRLTAASATAAVIDAGADRPDVGDVLGGLIPRPATATPSRPPRIAAFDGQAKPQRFAHRATAWLRELAGGHGATGRVSSPTVIDLGGGEPQDVAITPTPRQGRAGRKPSSEPIRVNVHMGSVAVRSDNDAKQVGDHVGRLAARKIKEALLDSDDVDAVELIA